MDTPLPKAIEVLQSTIQHLQRTPPQPYSRADNLRITEALATLIAISRNVRELQTILSKIKKEVRDVEV